jgi:hypothetical protein
MRAARRVQIGEVMNRRSLIAIAIGVTVVVYLCSLAGSWGALPPKDPGRERSSRDLQAVLAALIGPGLRGWLHTQRGPRACRCTSSHRRRAVPSSTDCVNRESAVETTRTARRLRSNLAVMCTAAATHCSDVPGGLDAGGLGQPPADPRVYQRLMRELPDIVGTNTLLTSHRFSPSPVSSRHIPRPPELCVR